MDIAKVNSTSGVEEPKQIGNLIDRTEEANILGNTFKSPQPEQPDKTDLIPTDKTDLIPTDEASNLSPHTENGESKIQELNSTIQLLQRNILFEKIYSFIYGSQIKILILLESNKNQFVNIFMLQPMYNEFVTKAGNNSINFNTFISYLVSFNLVETDLTFGQYKITTYGIDFLNYIRETYSVNWMFRNL